MKIGCIDVYFGEGIIDRRLELRVQHSYCYMILT